MFEKTKGKKMKRLSKLQVSMISMLALASLTLASCGSSIGSGQSLPGLSVFGISSDQIKSFDTATKSDDITAGLNKPKDIALDNNNKIYVINKAGFNISKFNYFEENQVEGTLTDPDFLYPQNPAGLAISAENTIYLTDGNKVLKFPAIDGEPSLSSEPIIATKAVNVELNNPKGLTHKDNFLYLADRDSNRIVIFSTISGLEVSEIISTTIEISISNPNDIAIDPSGAVMAIANTGGKNIHIFKKLEANTSWEYVDTIATGGSGPTGVSIDENFNVFASLPAIEAEGEEEEEEQGETTGIIKVYRYDIENQEWNNSNEATITNLTSGAVPTHIKTFRENGVHHLLVVNEHDAISNYTYEVVSPEELQISE